MKAPFSLLARFLLVTFALANSLDAANPSAADVRRALGADRGLLVVLINDAWSLTSELAKATQLTLLVQASNAAAVTRMRKLAEHAGWLGSRVYVERDGKRIHLARHMADGVIVGTGADAGDVARVARSGATLFIDGKLSRAKAVAGLGDWTHPYHGPDNNPQSTDPIARGPYLTRFWPRRITGLCRR